VPEPHLPARPPSLTLLSIMSFSEVFSSVNVTKFVAENDESTLRDIFSQLQPARRAYLLELASSTTFETLPKSDATPKEEPAATPEKSAEEKLPADEEKPSTEQKPMTEEEKSVDAKADEEKVAASESELACAATKIQASFRGNHTRKEMQAARDQKAVGPVKE